MKLWVSKNYWWALPAFVFTAILCFARIFNYSTEYEFELTIYAILLFMAAVFMLFLTGVYFGISRKPFGNLKKTLAATFGACFLFLPAWTIVSHLPPQMAPRGSYGLEFSQELWSLPRLITLKKWIFEMRILSSLCLIDRKC